jgi:lysophospholipase L1-like esterase
MAAANRRIRALIQVDGNAEFIDIAEAMLAGTDGPPADDLFVKDGLHLSKKGYALWNDAIRGSLPRR